MTRTELVLLRHGESVWNAEHRYQGQQGTGLSARGRQQAKEAAAYLKALQIDEIVASDLQRVTETLQPYVDTLDRPSVRIDRRWREIDVGTWGGRTFADVYADEPDVVDAFARGEDVSRGGGETFRQLRARVWQAIQDICNPESDTAADRGTANAGTARAAGVGALDVGTAGTVGGGAGSTAIGGAVVGGAGDAGTAGTVVGGAGDVGTAADADAGVAGAGRVRRVLVVTHGGPIRVAVAAVLRLPAGAEMLLDPPGNCSVTTLRLDGLTAYNVPTGVER